MNEYENGMDIGDPWKPFYDVVELLKDEHFGIKQYSKLIEEANQVGHTELATIYTQIRNEEMRHVNLLSTWLKTKGIDLIS
jgi:rubrerythrin